MSKLQLAPRWLVVVVLTGTLAGCSGEATAPSSSSDQTAFATQRTTSTAPVLKVPVPVNPIPIGVRPPCDNPLSERFCPLLP